MQKKIKVTKEVEETHTYCDCCGKEFHWGVCAHEMHSCKMCENVMCDDCRCSYPISNEVSQWYDAYDETPYICKDCDGLIKPFAKRFNKLWDKYLDDKEMIKKEWRGFRSKLGRISNHGKSLKE